jgi:dolichyl-phosphate-mannose--protein O-mannosyl transferase/Gpi18-like mannosyltransferase
VLLGGLLLRLLIAYVIMPGEGLGNDLRLFTTWATTLANVGPSHFYGTSSFADYPPGYLYVLWLLGSVSSLIAGVVGSTTGEVIQPLLKLPAILVDVVIALLLYRALHRWRDERTGLIAAGIYLLVPVTWYDSAVWGQVDAFGALLLLVTVLLLIDGWSEGASGVAMLAAVTKPQYAIGLVVVGSVLLGRHLLRRGTGPVPVLPRRLAAGSGVAGRIGAWLTEQQGIGRLVTSAVTAAVVFIVVTAPFDLPALASNDLAGIPLIGHIAGFASLIGSAAAYYNVLTANAFNMWALVGPTPLTHAIGHDYMWTFDTIQVLGPLTAATVGAGLLALLGLAVAVTLVFRDDRWTIVLSLTVLAIGFYALPTRVHERYLFPTFVTGAVLAATSFRWRLWYVAAAVLNAANLHAIMTLPFEGYGTPGTHGMPLATTLREDPAVIVIAIGQTVLFGVAFAVFFATVAWPTLRAAPSMLRRRSEVHRAPAIRMARPLGPSELPARGEPHRAGDGPGTATSPPRVASRSFLAAAPRPPTVHAPLPAAAPAAQAAEEPVPAGDERAPIGELRVRLARIRSAIATRVVRVVDAVTARLPRASGRDRSADHAGEPGGRLDRRDLVVVLALIAATFGMRAYRLDIPRTEFFDEYWHATTAMEFLQDWTYGIPHTLSEVTHPHLAKYAMALGIAALGDNKVTGTTDVGAPVVDAMLQPVFPAGPGGRLGGDRLVVATGSDIRVAPHGDLARLRIISLPGASALAADPGSDAIFIGTRDGLVIRMDGATLDGAGGPSGMSVVGTLGSPVSRLWGTGPGRVVSRTAGDKLTLLDVNAHAVLGSVAIPGVSGIVPLTVPGKSIAVASVPSGLVELETDTLTVIDSMALAEPVTGVTLVNGSDQGRRNRELLGQPTLYLATGTPAIDTVVVAADGTLSVSGGFPMPGVVTDLRWNETVNMVHALGMTPDGRPTIYVVDPHRNSVFADAPLSFQPATWLLDAEPRAPTLDRQRALAFAATGSVASVDIGSNAFAWRFPGVIAGALMAGLLFLLTRLLFRRRIVGLLVAGIVPLDGLLFSQSRIAMNDSYVGLFVVAAFTLLAWLLRAPPSIDELAARTRPWRRRRWELILGLPLLGVLLGLALASKWVGAYAMGAVILLVLLRSWAGRWLAFAALAGLTALFGHLAVAEAQPNVVFFLVMLLLTALFGVAMVRTGQLRSWSSARGDHPDPSWVDPRWRRGVPFLYAMACLTVVPLVVYIVSYIPWAISTAGGPQLFDGWPPGNTGQTFADLQVAMYRYHNELRAPHGASSPWWAWPFDLKPVWGYLDSFLDGNGATVLLSGNTFLLWLGVPAAAFGCWQAWRRRSQALGFAAIAFLCLWLPWSRIDRVSFNYHFYAAMPFLFVLLAYFLAELWDGPSPRTWVLARVSAVIVLLFPALLWLGRDQLCGAIGGVDQANPGAIVCNQPASQYLTPVLEWLAGAVIVGLVVLLLVRRPRWLVGGVLVVAAAWFVVLYPALAALNVPADWPWMYQGLLPSWDSSFYFNNNQTPVVAIPLFDIGLVATGVITVAAALGAMAAAGWRVRRAPPAAAETPDQGQPGVSIR